MSIEEISEKDIRRLWISKMNVLKIFRDRGCDVKSLIEDYPSLEEFTDYVRNQLDSDITEVKKYLKFESVTSKSEKIIGMWLEEPKLAINIRDVSLELEESGYKYAMIIVDEGVTPAARSFISGLQREKKIQVICYKLIETLIDITQHRLVPKYTRCSPSERSTILRRYNITSSKQMPQLRLVDPIAKRYGYRPGDLIRIERKSISNPDQTSITYRIVVQK